MGRTLATATQIILEEQTAFADFRRTLRASDQQIFDALFAGARKHTAAISMAAHALPFESILLATLLEEHRKVQELDERLQALEHRLARLEPRE